MDRFDGSFFKLVLPFILYFGLGFYHFQRFRNSKEQTEVLQVYQNVTSRIVTWLLIPLLGWWKIWIVGDCLGAVVTTDRVDTMLYYTSHDLRL